jgi:hypothetical protein
VREKTQKVSDVLKKSMLRIAEAQSLRDGKKRSCLKKIPSSGSPSRERARENKKGE